MEGHGERKFRHDERVQVRGRREKTKPFGRLVLLRDLEG